MVSLLNSLFARLKSVPLSHRSTVRDLKENNSWGETDYNRATNVIAQMHAMLLTQEGYKYHSEIEIKRQYTHPIPNGTRVAFWDDPDITKDTTSNRAPEVSSRAPVTKGGHLPTKGGHLPIVRTGPILCEIPAPLSVDTQVPPTQNRALPASAQVPIQARIVAAEPESIPFNPTRGSKRTLGDTYTRGNPDARKRIRWSTSKSRDSTDEFDRGGYGAEIPEEGVQEFQQDDTPMVRERSDSEGESEGGISKGESNGFTMTMLEDEEVQEKEEEEEEIAIQDITTMISDDEIVEIRDPIERIDQATGLFLDRYYSDRERTLEFTVQAFRIVAVSQIALQLRDAGWEGILHHASQDPRQFCFQAEPREAESREAEPREAEPRGSCPANPNTKVSKTRLNTQNTENIDSNHGDGYMYYVTIADDGRFFARCTSPACKGKCREVGRLDARSEFIRPLMEGNNLALNTRRWTMFTNHRLSLDNSWIDLHGSHEEINQRPLPSFQRFTIPPTGTDTDMDRDTNTDRDRKSRINVVIRSAMDTQKTTRLREYLNTEEQNFPRILIVSCRQSLTEDLMGRFGTLGFVDYRDLSGPDDFGALQKAPRLIIQIDSLHRLRTRCKMAGDFIQQFRDYDLIVIDEISCALQHLGYRKMRNRLENAGILQYYLKNTPNFIGLCADYNHKCAEFLTPLRPDLHLVMNKAHPPVKKYVRVYNDEGRWDAVILDLLKKGKKIAIPTNSKSKATILRKKIIEGGIPEDKILWFDSDSPKEIRRMLRDCNRFFVEYTVLIYTPTVSVSNDFHLEHFDYIFAYGINMSNTAREFVQGIGRIRKTREIHLFCSRDTMPNQYSILTLAQLSDFARNNVDRFVHQLEGSFFHTEMDQNGMWSFPGAETNPLFRLSCHNILDQNNSRVYFRSLVLQAFDTMGYEIEEVPESTPEEVEEARAHRKMNTVMRDEIKENEIQAIAAVQEPRQPPIQKQDHIMTPENKAWLFNQFYEYPDGNRDVDFLRKWKDRSPVRNAEKMFIDDADLDTRAINNLNEDPSSALSSSDADFKRATTIMFDKFEITGLWHQGNIKIPEKVVFKDDKEKKWVARTLGLGKTIDAKSAVILKKMLGLFGLQLEKKKYQPRIGRGKKQPQVTEYSFQGGTQEEMYHILVRRHQYGTLQAKIIREAPPGFGPSEFIRS
jgi:hypothetical protein